MTFAILSSLFRQVCAARTGAVADPRYICKYHNVTNVTYDLGTYRKAQGPLQPLDLPPSDIKKRRFVNGFWPIRHSYAAKANIGVMISGN
jgi:hypothetical protein